MNVDYRKCRRPRPRTNESGGDGLRKEVHGGPNRRVRGYLRLPRRRDRHHGDRLAVQTPGEGQRATVSDLAQVRRDAEPPERGDLVDETARHDALEAREVSRNVQREAVGRDASRDAHLDRRDLRGPAVRKVDPHPGLAPLAPRGDSVGRERVGERELDRADVANEVIVLPETGDRISDELPGSV